MTSDKRCPVTNRCPARDTKSPAHRWMFSPAHCHRHATAIAIDPGYQLHLVVERIGEKPASGGANSCASHNIVPVVLPGSLAGDSGQCGHSIGRQAYLPAIAPNHVLRVDLGNPPSPEIWPGRLWPTSQPGAIRGSFPCVFILPSPLIISCVRNQAKNLMYATFPLYLVSL